MQRHPCSVRAPPPQNTRHGTLLPSWPPACLPACLPAYLPACRPSNWCGTLLPPSSSLPAAHACLTGVVVRCSSSTTVSIEHTLAPPPPPHPTPRPPPWPACRRLSPCHLPDLMLPPPRSTAPATRPLTRPPTRTWPRSASTWTGTRATCCEQREPTSPASRYGGGGRAHVGFWLPGVGRLGAAAHASYARPPSHRQTRTGTHATLSCG